MRPVFHAAALLLVPALAIPPAVHADTFGKVKLIVNAGERGEEQDVLLRFEDEALVVSSRGGTVLKVFPYEAIRTAEYSYSKSPRWKSGIGVAVAVGIFALPVFFMKGKKHWLTLTAEDDFAVLRLDKRNYKLILPALEARTGKRVETVAEER